MGDSLSYLDNLMDVHDVFFFYLAPRCTKKATRLLVNLD